VPNVKDSIRLKSALFAVGGSLAALPAAAIELGDVKVHSTLGQPLRASIAYALAPNEAISDACVSLIGGPNASGMPTVSRASLIVTDGVIAITGNSAVSEPLVSMRVNVRCAYTPQLTREYMLFIDPADTQVTTASEPVVAPVEAPVVTRRETPAPRPAARPRPVNTEPITSSTRYRVQPGDSLSEIAQRIENRPVGLWPAINAIFAANPEAFIDQDINKLKAGSWLNIPDFGAGEPVTIVEAESAPATPAEPVSAGSAYSPGQLDAAAPPAEEASEPVSIVESSAIDEPVAETAARESESPLVDLRPGDIIDDSLIIPDTVIDAPQTTATQPNVPVAIVQESASEASGSNWIAWLIGAGLALIGGLLVFGRFRGRFGSAPIGAASAQPQRRRTDGDTQRIDAISEPEVDIDEFADIDDDAPTAENLALDADLIIGTGLSEGTDVDVSQDFAFASTTELDLELPEEISSGADTKAHTDIIPPLNIDESSILESEVMPDDEDDYDMSVIVDATKMPDPNDVTERDLEAIAVTSDDETLVSGGYTLSQEVDYKVLEQDYEDELTATQALNAEIQKAAEELALREDEMPEDDTKEMSMATVHELDVTAQMRGKNDDDIGDDDDTGINHTIEMEADDKTAEMPAREDKNEVDDKTVEMPAKGSKAS
jgi:hypothetical protein